MLSWAAKFPAQEHHVNDKVIHQSHVLRGWPFNSWGRGWVISGHQEFFSSNLVGRTFFSLFFPISFLLHLCCTQFFSSDKRLQEIFFKITHPRPLSRVKWSALNHMSNPRGLETDMWFSPLVFLASSILYSAFWRIAAAECCDESSHFHKLPGTKIRHSLRSFAYRNID